MVTSKCHALVLLAALLLAVSVPTRVLAEGNCPPGLYPIGGQGVVGCAPIPSASSASPDPRPAGRWETKWGALALGKNGVGTAATNAKSKRAAEKEAVSTCSARGGVNCTSRFTYKNGCAAAANAEAGVRGDRYSADTTEEIAKRRVLEYCERTGGITCRVVYSGCSESVFHPE